MSLLELHAQGPIPGIRQRIRAIIPSERRVAIRRMLARAKVFGAYGYDARRFMRASTAGRMARDPECLAAHISMDYHRLEKGMALPSPRPGFGRDVVRRLIRTVGRYEASYGPAEITAFARSALACYRRSYADAGLTSELDAFLRGSAGQESPRGGVEELTTQDLFAFDDGEAQRFLTSRRSVRQFTGELLPDDVITRAVRIAQRAPSVCNRQSARVFACNQRERMNRILELQNGNRGFGETLGAVVVVASDMRAFASMGERNQCWVDGGIFAMSLALAFHSLRVGACMLNWSVEPDRDRRLRRQLEIGDNYAVITMLGAGYVRDPMVVAASPRRQPGSIVSFV